jgi:hypothetical protein
MATEKTIWISQDAHNLLTSHIAKFGGSIGGLAERAIVLGLPAERERMIKELQEE